MRVRWCYIVESVDRHGIFARETFMHPQSAAARYELLRRRGFYRVTITERRVRAHGQTSAQRPGLLLGR